MVSQSVIDIIERSTGAAVKKQQENLSLLRSGDARIVVTGQQLGLLGGPLLTAYKILTAIKVAQVRSAAGTPTVPVFWLQAEDQDTVEVNELNFISDEGRLVSTKLNSDSLDARNRSPVGLLQGLSELPMLAQGVGLPRMEMTSLLESFQTVVQEYFADYGLLFLNPLLLQESSLTVPLYLTALIHAEEIEHKLLAKERQLLVEGIDPTVKVRKGSPLFFLQTKKDSFSRFRLAKGGDSYVSAESNTSFTVSELEKLLQSEPSRFSSSALFRPIIQDALLNPAAYVGGPAEERYLELASSIYEQFGITRSDFIPRASLLIVEPRVRRAIKKLGEFDIEELTKLSTEELLARIGEISVGPDREAELNTVISSKLDALYSEIDPIFAILGEQGRSYLARSRDKFDRAARGIIDTYHSGYRDRLNRDAKTTGLIYDSLGPRGSDQERVLSWYPLFKRLGPAIIDSLLDKIELDNLRNRRGLVL